MTNGIAHCDYLTDAGLKHLQLNTKFARTLKPKLEIYRYIYPFRPRYIEYTAMGNFKEIESIWLGHVIYYDPIGPSPIDVL